MTTRPATPRHDQLEQLEATGSPNADIYRSIWANDLARESRALAAFEAAARAESAEGRIELARLVGGEELAHLFELEDAGPSAGAQAAVFENANAMKLKQQRARFDAATADPPDEVA